MQPAFAKQVTAAGFQLKGSGWYATDFKGGKSDKKADATTDGGDGAKTDAAKTDTSKTEAGKTEASKTEASKSDNKATGGGKSGDSATPAKSGDASTSSSAPKAAGGGRPCACH